MNRTDCFDFSKLRGRAVEKYGSYTGLSIDMGMSRQALSSKLNSRVAFSQYEILRLCQLLDIPTKSIGDYFFCIKSQKV